MVVFSVINWVDTQNYVVQLSSRLAACSLQMHAYLTYFQPCSNSIQIPCTDFLGAWSARNSDITMSPHPIAEQQHTIQLI